MFPNGRGFISREPVGVAGGRFPAPFLPVPRTKLTSDEIQALIKTRAAELGALMWLKAWLCFSQMKQSAEACWWPG